ncbi:Agglutination protein [Cronobacter universalis NCTC 9529]|nr:Agglutination protein [Cronobacter universalis NCTC 9529]
MHNKIMRYRRLALLLTTVLISFPAVSQEEFAWQNAPAEQLQAQLTIKEAILRAFARNPKISQAAAQIRVGKANLEEAQSAWFPQVSLQGNVGRNHRTDSSGSLNSNAAGGVNLKQLIYDFGKTGGSIDEQENLSEAYRFQLYDTLNQVGMQTLQAYLQVRRYQSLAAAAERNLESLRSVQNMADLRSEAGLSTQSDVLQAQSRIAGMNATLEQYRAQTRSAQAALSVLTGVVADTLPDLPEDLLRQPITLKSLRYEQTNAVRAAQARQLAAEQRIRQAQAQHWPTVSVQAGRTRYQNDNANYWDDQVQLVVDAPVYQGGAVSARVEAAEGDRARARGCRGEQA